jgi:hypothetical protein
LEEAVREFQGLPSGKGIKVNLYGMGSMEGARAVIEEPGAVPIHVWSPASSVYRDVFESDWRSKHHNNPILKSENLALTPMVFVMRESRQQPVVKKYGKPSFRSIGEAMFEPNGWEAIAGQPDWGRWRSESGSVTVFGYSPTFNLVECKSCRPSFWSGS